MGDNMIIYVDMDGVLCDYEAAFMKNQNEVCEFPQSIPGFFRTLAPILGAIEGINKLVALGYEVYILTSPSIKNPHCWTEKAQWVEEHLGFEWLKKLIITKQKGLLHKDTDSLDNRTYLIDDHNVEGGRYKFFDAGDMYWFMGSDAKWAKVIEFFSG